jgi:hypothetical protein
MQSIDQVYDVSPIVINELYKYYIFELNQTQRDSIKMVRTEKDLYKIVKSVGASLVQDNMNWSAKYDRVSEYKARTYNSDPTVGPFVPVENNEKLQYYLEAVNKNREMPGSLEDWMIVSGSDSDYSDEDCWASESTTPDESEGEEFYPENF